ncbi:hypothetical protein RFI_15866 [Reticulomyxa filosa]|uniref:Acyl-CoA dehydrogenase n=1 Tax=Reticulomyxa filosa TaxID=46433 RepID=X6N6F8_RETFI|nr:hypothetical protein RFI_15866 [Reticulomyxa filosa]|eukprot:ETO21339.1 hypothetical protein RFI_15866 [Reticulomyxa filosa]
MTSKKHTPSLKKDMVAYSEPYFAYQPSPFYNQSHFEFRDKVRNFIDKELIPHVDKWDESETFPVSLHQKALRFVFYENGVYCPQFETKYGGQRPPKWDYFHFLIFHDELARTACGGLVASLFLALQIGASPLMMFGSEYLKDKIGRDILSGKKLIALAVSEPSGGSDVSRIKTTAVVDPSDPDYFIVNGEKYFITNGMRADYFTTAVRTGSTKKQEKESSGALQQELSMLLIPKAVEGVFCQQLKTQGWWCSSTAHVVLRNVRVHKKFLIGELNKGWEYIMKNFNHERFAMSVESNRYARVCLEESIKYAKERHTFGKPLINHQVIRHKLSEMIRVIESTHALLEQIAYLSNQQPGVVDEKHLAGLVALGKVQSTKTMEFCAREAAQIFGGRGFMRTGRAGKVERIYREVRVNAIGGGSEEILLNLAANQAKF